MNCKATLTIILSLILQACNNNTTTAISIQDSIIKVLPEKSTIGVVYQDTIKANKETFASIFLLDSTYKWVCAYYNANSDSLRVEKDSLYGAGSMTYMYSRNDTGEVYITFKNTGINKVGKWTIVYKDQSNQYYYTDTTLYFNTAE